MRYYIFFSILLLFSCNEGYEKKLELKEYKGIISQKYEDKKDHNARIFKVQVENNEFEELAFVFGRAYDYAQTGDSIVKNAGEMKITIIKRDGRRESFYYE